MTQKRKRRKKEKMKFGVFTVCMPEYDIPESIALLADLGYDGIEFRVKELVEETEEGLASHNPDNKQYPYRYWGYNKSTLDVNNIMEEAKKAKALCDEHGLDVFGLSGYVCADYPETLRKIFEAAKAIDCEIVRVGLVTFDPEKPTRPILKPLPRSARTSKSSKASPKKSALRA